MSSRTLLSFAFRAALAVCAVGALEGCGKSRRLAGEEPLILEWTTIGESSEGRPIEAMTLGGGAGPRVYVVGVIHGDEQEGVPAVEAMVERYAGAGGAVLRVVRDGNPDGSAAGTRASARGVDLNRNWPAANFRPSNARGAAPLSEPETTALYADLTDFAPDVVIVFHSARAGPYVNFDGPAAELARLFAGAAAAEDERWHTLADMGYATPGSIGSLLGVDRGIPVLTVEFAHGHEPGAAAAAVLAGMDAIVSERAAWETAGAASGGPASSDAGDSAARQ